MGRKDRGIEKVSDLEGKRIGVPLKTAAEFYLGRFLDLHGMNIKQVTLVDVSPPQVVDALVNGDVDAVLAWQPNAKALEDRLGDGIVKWPAQNEQVTYCTVISTQAWTADHPELVGGFLSSLAQAEEYFILHPAEAKAIVQKRLKYDDAYMAAIWPEHQFSLSLDQSLMLAMEDEARWMINNNLTSEKQTPDFLDYIYTKGLEATKPEAVNIIR
jgi:NitT/TauT family transport system substrate-binding protein